MSLSTSNRLLALLIVTAPFAVIIGGLVTAAAIVITDRDAEPGSAIVDMTATPVPGISADDLISLGFSGLPPVTMPADNPLNEAKVKLGRMLFLDDRLSAAGTLSCASCHQPSQGWGDGLDISFGFPPGTPRRRNSQTIINSRYLPKLFWAGEKSSLDAQAKSAFSGIAAQNLDSILAEERLRQIPEYVELFREAFGGEPSFDDALYAVAAFESTINSTNVPFDAYLQGDASALSESALRGVELFVGQARCSVCHSGPLLTDNSFHAIGVPDNSRFGTDPLRQVTLRYQNSARGVPEDVYRTVDSDLRLSYVTKQDIDKGKFRTPMLLEVGQNGPYMHNGVFETLEGVVKFYNVGGGNAENKSPVIEPLDLDDQEIADLVAFLGAVTGDEILVDAPELPDY